MPSQSCLKATLFATRPPRKNHRLMLLWFREINLLPEVQPRPILVPRYSLRGGSGVPHSYVAHAT